MKLGDEIECSGCSEVFTPAQHTVYRINSGKVKKPICGNFKCRAAINKKNNSLPPKAGNEVEYRAAWYSLFRERESARHSTPEYRRKQRNRRMNPGVREIRNAEQREYNRMNRDSISEIKGVWYSKKVYGVYAEAHRALLNLETETKERKDGT